MEGGIGGIGLAGVLGLQLFQGVSLGINQVANDVNMGKLNQNSELKDKDIKPLTLLESLEILKDIVDPLQKENVQPDRLVYQWMMQNHLNIQEAEMLSRQVHQKKGILFYGGTGTGKSTLANAMILGSENMVESEQNGKIYFQIKDNKEEVFKTAATLAGCTQMPKFNEVEPGIVVIDCPGLNDPKPQLELCNQTNIHIFHKRLSNWKFILALDWTKISESRGQHFLPSIIDAMNIIRPEHQFAPEEYGRYIVPVFTKDVYHKATDTTVSKVFDDFIEIATIKMTLADENSWSTDFSKFDPEKQKKIDDARGLFNSKEYPKDKKGWKQLVTFLKFIQEKVICIHPEGKSNLPKIKTRVLDPEEFFDQLKNDLNYPNKCGSIHDVPTDIPGKLALLQKQLLFDKLLVADKFRSKRQIRSAVFQLIYNTLYPWDGKEKNALLQAFNQLRNTAEAAGKDVIFGWYMTDIYPQLVSFARAEGEQGWGRQPIEKAPLALVVTEFALKFDVYNEDDTFTMNHWLWICQYFKDHSDKMATLKYQQFKKYPNVQRDGNGVKIDAQGNQVVEQWTDGQTHIGLYDVFKFMYEVLKYKSQHEDDQEMIEIWTQQLKVSFITLFEYSCPSSFNLRFDRKQIKNRCDYYVQGGIGNGLCVLWDVVFH